MSEKEQQRSNEPPKAKDAVEASEKDARLKDGGKKGIDYVFKIVPADPKNSFDFEDVADK